MATTNIKSSDQWYFTKEQLENTPSRQCGFDAMKELQYRQQAANFIQDMGQRLKVSQLCINTAIVYMHRFYVFHSFTHFPWHQMAAAALFLAAKVEEQPRKLEYVIKVANICRNPRDTNIDINSERYIAQSQDLVFNENVLLQTLGFEVAIDHPHTHVVTCCHLVRASKDLAQTSYFMASNSLHLTTMCLQYKPTVVACFCILLACKWSNWKIPLSNEQKEWYYYVDQSVTAELLDQLTKEFLEIFENCPSRLKEKIMALSDNQTHTPSHSSQSNSPFDQDPKKVESTPHKSLQDMKQGDHHKHRTHSSHHSSRDERREREKMMMMAGKTLPSRPPSDPKMKSLPHSSHPHSRPSGSGTNYPPQASREPRDILREAAKEAPFGLANIRDPHSKDPTHSRSSDKREQMNYPDARLNYEKQRLDSNGRPRVDPAKVAKPEHPRNKYDDQIKKHLSAAYDKNGSSSTTSNSSLMKSSTSQKVDSPLLAFDSGKTVPRTGVDQQHAHMKAHYTNNGDSGGSGFVRTPQESDIKIKKEPVVIKDELSSTQPVVKRSLFSPDSTPPYQKLSENKEPISHSSLSAALSPMKSPNTSFSKSRTYSSSSTEAELRPTLKKIEEIEGFENIMRDSTIGIAHVSEVKNEPELEIKKEPIDVSKSGSLDSGLGLSQSSLVNGLETNPTIISNLLKEAPTVSHLSTSLLSTSNHADSLVKQEKEKEHHHHKSKKKKEKHKHKDKDKSKEEKEKKKKHKDKDRHRHKDKKVEESAVETARPVPSLSEPIKIKIQKDKIQPLPDAGLKIKIPKDRIVDSLPQHPSGGLKIKIPKEMIANCSQSSNSVASADGNASRKRERTSSTDQSPPFKLSKSSHSKQNGRHSHSKVSIGDGDTSMQRLAESKYSKQGSST